MGTNTLVDVITSATVTATHKNEIHQAMEQEFVGRNTSGVATAGQQLGTLLIPWGAAYIGSLNVGGSSVDLSGLTSEANRIVSGAIRSLSEQPDFLRPTGSGLNCDILASTIDLVVVINGATYTITSNINLTGLTAAPSSQNTADVDDTSLTGQTSSLYQGERDTVLTLDNAGTEVTSLVGQVVAFEGPSSGEIMIGYLKSSTEFVQAYRGFFLNNAGADIPREVLSNNDTLTLLKLGWVFVENDLVTAEVSYSTPVIAFDEPGSPATGDYWLDLTNATWKRYSGSAFVVINRTLIGVLANNTTTCIGARSFDFFKIFSDYNDLEIYVDSNSTVKTRDNRGQLSVLGETFRFDWGAITWDMTTDIQVTEAANTVYYFYLDRYGERFIDDERPYERKDLKGFYHPFEAWRCVGAVLNDGSLNLSTVTPQDGPLGEDGGFKSEGAIPFLISNVEKMRIETDGKVGIGDFSNDTLLGRLHSKSGDSGASSVNAIANSFVIEGSGNSGMTIVTPDANIGNIYFADASADNSGKIQYDHSADEMWFTTNASRAVTITSNQKIGIGEETPEALTHIKTSDVAGAAALSASADEFLIEHATAGGMTIRSTTTGNIFFGDATSSARGRITYDHSDDSLALGTASAERFFIKSSGRVGILQPHTLGVGVHIETGDSGVTSVLAGADELIIEGSGNTGLSILTPASNIGIIAFADPDDDNIGQIKYSHVDNDMTFTVSASALLTLDGPQQFVGINASGADLLGKLHVRTSDAGAITPAVRADELILENSGNCGLTIYSGTTSTGSIIFGDSGDDTAAEIKHNHSGDSLSIVMTGATGGIDAFVAFEDSVRLGRRTVLGSGATQGFAYLPWRSGSTGTPGGVGGSAIGAMYFNTSGNTLEIYDGSSWVSVALT